MVVVALGAAFIVADEDADEADMVVGETCLLQTGLVLGQDLEVSPGLPGDHRLAEASAKGAPTAKHATTAPSLFEARDARQPSPPSLLSMSPASLLEMNMAVGHGEAEHSESDKLRIGNTEATILEQMMFKPWERPEIVFTAILLILLGISQISAAPPEGKTKAMIASRLYAQTVLRNGEMSSKQLSEKQSFEELAAALAYSELI